MTRRIEAAGEKVTIGPKVGVDGNWQVWTVDPDGNKIEIMQYAENAPAVTVLSPYSFPSGNCVHF